MMADASETDHHTEMLHDWIGRKTPLTAVG